MPNHSPYIIGLTGGIGSGKTTVSNLFRGLGVEVIDADEISRQLVRRGTPQLEAIAGHFGRAILDSAGNLDRKALRRLVFNDPEERNWLEQLLHPAIREAIDARVQASAGDYVILVVPLLVESGQYGFVDRVLVVDVPETLQVERTTSRDDSDASLVRQIMDSQVSRQERLAAADDIIDNTVSPQELATRVAQLHARYSRAGRAEG